MEDLENRGTDNWMHYCIYTHTHKQGCMQKFCKGRANLGYLKNEGGKFINFKINILDAARLF